MLSLLQIEWMKIRRYRTFWILMGLFAAVLVLWNYEMAAGVFKIGPSNFNVRGCVYTFPDAWANLGWWSSLFILFVAILVITVTANEYTFRTHRQNIIDGWTRLQFFHAKFSLVIGLSIALALFQAVLGLVFGLAYGSRITDFTKGISDLGYYLLLAVNYLGAALTIALLIRRSGLAIALFMIYSLFAETGIWAFANYMSGTHVGDFLPLQSSDMLLPYPVFERARAMGGDNRSTSLPEWYYVLASSAWIVGYYFTGRLLVTKRDL